VRAYQAAAADVIQPYNGYIAQYLGDGLMVDFGWPQAHEDAASRAVYASLAVLDTLARLNAQLEPQYSVRLQARIGLHTGLAVVGTMGGGTRQEQLAMGNTPNIAARIQGLAAPDTVVLSAATARLVQSAFVLETLGTHSLKGVSEPMTVWRVRGPVVVHDDNEEASITSGPFLVGRDEEIGLLHWQRDDTPAMKLDTLEHALQSYGLPLQEVIPLLAALLSVPLQGRYAAPTLPSAQQKQQTLDALVAWLVAEAERQPVLVAWEDLPWADPTTLEVLGLLIDQAPTVPMLHVLTCRPQFSPPWPHRSEAMALYTPDDHRFYVAHPSLDPGVNSLSRLSWALWLLGYPEQALVRSQQTLTLAREAMSTAWPWHTTSPPSCICCVAKMRPSRNRWKPPWPWRPGIISINGWRRPIFCRGGTWHGTDRAPRLWPACSKP
jgi:hypothetical protein